MTSPFTPQLHDDPRPVPPISGSLVMGWMLLLSALAWPRLVILAFWVFSDLLGDAYDGWVVPVAGFLVLPWTTITYALMWGLSSDRVSGAEWLVVALAVVLDALTWAGTARMLSRD